ncbi:hypothetical protein K1T71_013127 [Dendrolimus kikuchii]|uniref:Uncharacterized protein n=1 Tax=Dendrolimus kikuchii TaxID=765133 RepID=A0ACC1CJE1_9NEOP|nr:hypothetical protein K1T71_013127 [Dendrolimus kikuchii]
MITYTFATFVSMMTLHVVAFADDDSKGREVIEKLKCAPPPTQCKITEETLRSTFDREFEVNGKSIHFSTYFKEELSIWCDPKVIAVDDPTFPHFETNVFKQELRIGNCKPPEIAYADAMTKLNITFASLVIYFEKYEDDINLNPNHFQGLNFLQAFTFRTKHFLANYFDIEILKYLSPNISLALKEVILPPFPSWNKFENVIIESGRPWKLSQTWGHCDHLRTLTIREFQVNVLPDGWLANCSKLEELRMEDLRHLRALPERMLENAISLRSLTIKSCKISVIANDFFWHLKNLKYLDMSSNHIRLKANETFMDSLTGLETAYFTQNEMEPQNFGVLRSLKSLKYLNLDYNYWAGVCEDDIYNIIHKRLKTWPYLPSVDSLSFSNTFGRKPCPEWRKAMSSLKFVNLSISGIDEPWNLTFEDIKLIRESGWKIDYTENNHLEILYNEGDYNAVLLEDTDKYVKNQAVIFLKSPVKCNCNWYWFIKTLKERPNHISIPGFSCIQYSGDYTPRPLDDIDPENIMCDLKEDCPIGCKCFKMPRTAAVLVNCTGRGLIKVPIIDNLKKLVIPNNHLSILESKDLPDSLENIDLRNNLLGVVTPDVARTLFSVASRKIQLSGNPIVCQCENKEFLELLYLNKQKVLDYENITCIDGVLTSPINTIELQSLCSSKMFSITLILLGCIIVFIILAGGIYYFKRSKINSFLAKHGIKCVEQDSDINKIYDAFISFSHEDTFFVTDELMPVLEDANGFKLCVHSRDWMIGDWIPAQIARSVQDSRRTIIVLSNNFLSSIWALLEFRTAHTQAFRDKRTRIIIILLEDLTSEVAIDDEIQEYLATNTYVKWGDANFWQKLLKALRYRENEKKIIEAGEKVARLYRSDDPPITLKAICNSKVDSSEIDLQE